MRVNVHEAKTNLSKLLHEVENGETVFICKRNVVVAELRASRGQDVPPPAKRERQFGIAKGLFEVTDAFFEPLPEDILRLWEGGEE